MFNLQAREIDDNAIIDFVKQNPILYNGKKQPNRHVWAPFATMLNVSVEECRLKWKRIRDKYVKRRKRLLRAERCTNKINTPSLSFLDDALWKNSALKKTNANTTKSSGKSMKRKQSLDTALVTADMFEILEKNEALRKNNQAQFEIPADFTIDEIPFAFCTNKEISTQITHPDTVSFKISRINVLSKPEEKSVEPNQNLYEATTQCIEENIVQLPVHQSIFKKSNDFFDTTVVNADMLAQIIERRKKEDILLANNQSLFQIQENTINQETPVLSHTSQKVLTPIQENFITLKVPKTNELKKTNEGTIARNPCVSTNETPPNLIFFPVELPKINYIKQNKMTSQNLSYIDISCIEEQYKETEKKSDNKSQNLEMSKDSTERYFNEMGEYVYNCFPQDKQRKLKKKIWSLIMKID